MYVTGAVRNVISFGGDLLYTSPLTVDLFLAKLGSANGEYRWARRLGGGTDYDVGNSVTVDEAKGELLTGGKYTMSIDMGGSVGILRAAGTSQTNGYLLTLKL